MTEVMAMSTLTGTSPFADHIDSSVEYGGGVWFSSGKYAMKTKTDLKGVMSRCKFFHSPNYWEATHGKFNDRMDACAWTPALGRVEGFWIFEGPRCIRVNGNGDKLIMGPYEITHESFWPKAKGTVFGGSIDAATFLRSTEESATFQLFKRSQGTNYVGTYTWHKADKQKKDQLEIKTLQETFDRAHEHIKDKKIDSVLNLGSHWYFFFGDQVFKQHKTDQTQDEGPGEITSYVPAFDSEEASPEQ